MGTVRPAGRALWMVAGFAAAASGCVGRTLSLGHKEPRRYHLEPPKIVGKLTATGRADNPTLTGDLLEIYFTSDRVSGNGDVWFARRADPGAAFDAPSPVTEVNSDA